MRLLLWECQQIQWRLLPTILHQTYSPRSVPEVRWVPLYYPFCRRLQLGTSMRWGTVTNYNPCMRKRSGPYRQRRIPWLLPPWIQRQVQFLISLEAKGCTMHSSPSSHRKSKERWFLISGIFLLSRNTGKQSWKVQCIRWLLHGLSFWRVSKQGHIVLHKRGQ